MIPGIRHRALEVYYYYYYYYYVSSVFGLRGFRLAGPAIWNSLPLSVTQLHHSYFQDLRCICLLPPSPVVELSSMRLWFDDLHLFIIWLSLILCVPKCMLLLLLSFFSLNRGRRPSKNATAPGGQIWTIHSWIAVLPIEIFNILNFLGEYKKTTSPGKIWPSLEK